MNERMIDLDLFDEFGHVHEHASADLDQVRLNPRARAVGRRVAHPLTYDQIVLCGRGRARGVSTGYT